MMLAAPGGKLEIPDPVHKFIVVLLLLRVGPGAGISIREADFLSFAVPAGAAAAVGVAIVLIGTGHSGAQGGFGQHGDTVSGIPEDTFRSPAISTLLLGIPIGMCAHPERVCQSFCESLFLGLLSVLMMVMEFEAWSRLSELGKVAHACLLFRASPIAHGLPGFAFGLAAHHVTGFSAGGIILASVMAASSSDISGPPTLRGALPEANAPACIGASTGLGTPRAILSIPIFIALADGSVYS